MTHEPTQSDLEAQLSAAQDKIIELEASIGKLKDMINSFCNLDNLSDEPTQAWEIRDMLYNWANGN